MKSYIGTKLIKATPMNLGEYNEYKGWDMPTGEDPAREGYLVVYSDSYESWSPKEVFESAYLGIINETTISKDDVKQFIKSVESVKLGEKTTVTQVTLVNGFVITESSSCVDPANFDMAMGEQICVERIENKIWELLGFLLQTAKYGIKQ